MGKYFNTLKRAGVDIASKGIHEETLKNAKNLFHEEPSAHFSSRFHRLIYVMNVLLLGALIMMLFLNVFSRHSDRDGKEDLSFLKARIDTMEKQVTLLQGIKEVVVLHDKKHKRLEKLLLTLDESLGNRLHALGDEGQNLRASASFSSRPPSSHSVKNAPMYPETYYHIVLEGENLYRIGLRYNVSVEELSRINNLTSKRFIKTGQRLLIKKHL